MLQEVDSERSPYNLMPAPLPHEMLQRMAVQLLLSLSKMRQIRVRGGVGIGII